MDHDPTQKLNVREAFDEYQELRSEQSHADAHGSALHQPTAVRRYYEIVTQFYQWGYGDSFHFAPRTKGESLSKSIQRQEEGIAELLRLQPGMLVADIGCGVGGPMMNIGRFSGANVTGFNISEHQIHRGRRLLAKTGLDRSCDFLQADFNSVPLSDSYFDAMYSIEALCHSTDLRKTYQELLRLLKPGAEIATLDWCMTEAYDDDDPIHRGVRARIEYSNSTGRLHTTAQLPSLMSEVGFEILTTHDQNGDQDVESPWYMTLQGLDVSLSSFARTPFGRRLTDYSTRILEFLGVAPPGTNDTSKLLNVAADSLVEAGELGIFTPSFLIHARKPNSNFAD